MAFKGKDSNSQKILKEKRQEKKESQNNHQKKDDLSGEEFIQLGMKYLKIPFALLLVEAFYWFLTAPSNTLAPVQVAEAWLWNEIVQLIWGDAASAISMHNGWLTRIDLYHIDFPGSFNSVGLYVSDECAGVHEMIFLATFVMLTDGVAQKKKLQTIAVFSILVFMINLTRLVLFYPIAVGACTDSPNDPTCLNDMWAFHRNVYEWGFLVLLILMWFIWFMFIGGPSRVRDSSKAGIDKWRFTLRKDWTILPVAGLVSMVMLMVLAYWRVTNDADAQAAREILRSCEFNNLVSAMCGNAQMQWDNSIQGAWSLSAVGLVCGLFSAVKIQKPDENGYWPDGETNGFTISLDYKSLMKLKEEE